MEESRSERKCKEGKGEEEGLNEEKELATRRGEGGKKALKEVRKKKR